MTVALSRRWALMSNSPASREMEGDAAFEVTVEAGTSVALRGISSSKTYNVLWGDGSTYSGTASSTSHTYTTAGTYTIETDATLSGSGSQIFDSNSFLRKVISWGSLFNGVASASRALQDCTQLSSIPSSWAGLEKVTNTDDMFAGCHLPSIPSSWAGLESVTNTGGMFSGCTQLSSIPPSWAGLEKVTNTDDMFSGCPLPSIPPSWAGLESVTNTGGMFSGCTQLSSIPPSWAGLEKVTGTGYMFAGCTQLSSIPPSWAGLEKVTSTLGKFRNCPQLSSIPSSWAGLESVTNTMDMFGGCTRLVTGGTADIGALSKVTNCYRMMDGCSSYMGNVLNLYNTLKIKCTSPDYNYRFAFRGCSLAGGYADLPYLWKN